jgi:hypothetical protein
VRFAFNRMAKIGMTRALGSVVVPIAAALMVVSPAWASIYGGLGQGDLDLDSGTLDIFTGDGINPPEITGSLTFSGVIEDDVAVFRFTNVNVGAGVTVNVTGDFPLAITSENDLEWRADISAAEGILGGGAGGGGGDAGVAVGVGGAGPLSGGAGGATAPGGLGGLQVGNPGSDGLAGTRNPGADGAAGDNGSAGEAGQPGQDGALGVGTTAASGVAGAGGAGGAAGAAGVNANNGGLGGNDDVGNADGGAGVDVPASPNPQAEVPGQTASNATDGTIFPAAPDGAPGGPGAPGGHGGGGQDGGNALFTVAANSFEFVGGAGGGGGGGGGTGGGGAGGGGGGGGSSGSSGGGGGGVDAPDCTGIDPAFGPPIEWTLPGNNAVGETGAAGGAGGAGGPGGTGGTAGSAGEGGSGGSGGGAVLLSARGLLAFGSAIDISAGTPGSGGAGTAANPGTAGSGGSAGSGPGSIAGVPSTGTWNYLDGDYCSESNSGTGGLGGQAQGGADGGPGGDGGPSGSSGDGGDGGFGTPGMVKLHGSVVLASSGSVIANNGAGLGSNQAGKLTLISNMNADARAQFSPSAVGALTSGFNINNALLVGPNSFDNNQAHPYIGELQGGAATEGILNPVFWNETEVMMAAQGNTDVELVRLSPSHPGNVFFSFDQIFVINNTGTVQDGVGISVGGENNFVLLPTTPIGTLQPGEIFTTTVDSGTTIFFNDEPIVGGDGDGDGDPIPATPLAAPLAVALMAAGLAAGGAIAIRRKRS